MSAKEAARISFGDCKHLMTSLQKTDSDDDIVVTSGEIPSNQEEVKGLFDVVKRDFRCSTAAILNRPLYENPETGKNCNRVPIKKLSYVKEMQRKVSLSLELKNQADEELNNENYRNAIKLYHHSLLYIKGLDPDEGITLYEDTCTKNSLRTMPDKLKEIKVKAEIDICSSLAICLMHKKNPPYKRIKEYSLRILNMQPDHLKALLRAGMACYHLQELELSRFYLNAAKDVSSSNDPATDIEVKRYLERVEKKLKSLKTVYFRVSKTSNTSTVPH